MIFFLNSEQEIAFLKYLLTLSVVDPSFVSSEEDVSLVFNAQSNSFLFFFFRARIGVAKGELVCALLITVICLSKLSLVL